MKAYNIITSVDEIYGYIQEAIEHINTEAKEDADKNHYENPHAKITMIHDMIQFALTTQRSNDFIHQFPVHEVVKKMYDYKAEAEEADLQPYQLSSRIAQTVLETIILEKVIRHYTP